MLVKALCTMKVWDNGASRFCYPGQEYEIESDGQLASLTVAAVAYDQEGNAVRFVRDSDGKEKAIRISKPPYIFEFDRNGTRTDAGVEVKKNYACKKCGKQCKTLPALGRHSRSCRVVPVPAAEVEDAVAK